MRVLKNIIISGFAGIVLITFQFCGNNSITGSDQIQGFYKAVAFTEPGKHDGGIDILDNGGTLTAQLTSDSKVIGYLHIPKNIESNYESVNRNYNGNFTINADTLRFQNTNTFLDNPQLIFIINGTRLETPDRSDRRALSKILLVKDSPLQ